MTRMQSGKVPTVSAAEFKAKCLAIFDSLDGGPEELLVTKRGKSVARVMRPPPKRGARLAARFYYPPSKLSARAGC